MLNPIPLLLLGFLAIASAVPAQQIKSLFSLDAQNHFSYQMFQVKDEVIGYTMTDIPNGPSSEYYIPQYYLFNLTAITVTPILNDLLPACGQTNQTVLDRLHWHVPTVSLVYYCTANNSLLILNEADYTVQSSITVNTTTTFQEVKLSTDGYNVAVLGMDTVFATNSTPSQLIRISMQSKTVVSLTTFNHDLNENEVVTGFDSNGKGLYILTTTVADKQLNVSIYSMTLISSSYQLTPFTNFTSEYLPDPTFIELWHVDDLIITNTLTDQEQYNNLLYLNNQGDIVKTEQELNCKRMKPKFPNRIAAVVDRGNSNVYTSVVANYGIGLNNVTQNHIKGSTIDSSVITSCSDMEVAVAAQPDHTSLFFIDYTGNIFSVMDLVTKDVIYTTIVDPFTIMITDTTYGLTYPAEDGSYLYIYDMETNRLISHYSIYYNYFHDQESNTVSTLNLNPKANEYILSIYDLQTGAKQVSNSDDLCNENILCNIVQFNSKNSSSPELVISNSNWTYTIVSSIYGTLLFSYDQPANAQQEQALIMDFDTMSFYFMIGVEATNETTISHYTFNPENKSFTLESSKVIYQPVGQYYPMSGYEVAVLFNSDEQPMLLTINMSNASATQYQFPNNSQWEFFTTFTANDGNNYIVFTNTGGPEAVAQYGESLPSIFNKQFDPLVDSTNITTMAYAAGKNSYYTLDDMPNVCPIRFYKLSVESKTESIAA